MSDVNRITLLVDESKERAERWKKIEIKCNKASKKKKVSEFEREYTDDMEVDTRCVGKAVNRLTWYIKDILDCKTQKAENRLATSLGLLAEMQVLTGAMIKELELYGRIVGVPDMESLDELQKKTGIVVYSRET